MRYKFGEKLRSIREKKELTMKEVAEKAGLSESLISQIERNKVSPAIDTLFVIAEILEIDMEYLFSDFKKNKAVHLVKAGKRNKVVLDGIIYEQLSRIVEDDEENGIEAYEMHIAVGGRSGSEDYGHKGKELGVIVRGRGEFSIGSEKYLLEKGDSISFDSGVPHRLVNTGNTELVSLWVITPPKKFMNL